jgi:hypothetical protein
MARRRFTLEAATDHVIILEFDAKIPGSKGERAGDARVIALRAELGDAMREARNFAAGVVLVHDAALRCTHDHRLGSLQCR